MRTIRIEMLGNFRVLVDGAPATALNKGRLQSLLAYLTLHRNAAVSREQLAFTLWPDSSESQARTNLRQLIHNLRHALPADCDLLEADTQTVRWRDGEACAIDVLEFEAALARAADARQQNDPAAERKALDEAAAVYQDDLLRSLNDDWVRARRDGLREQLGEALERLAALAADAGDFSYALRHAERLVTLDSLREPYYRLVIELHARNGDRASALRAYHQCMRVLKRELGVTPGDATRQLFERVLKSEAPENAPEMRPAAAPSALPMVGRRTEWERLRECWRRAATGESLLALIAGEPGIGKSRLAEELCQWATEQNAPVARARCYAARGQLAYAPVEDWLKSDALRAVRGELGKAQLQELARVTPEVLAERPDLEAPRPLTDSWQRRHFYEAMKIAVERAAQARPLLLLIDDLQWCDQDSFGWLGFLLTSGARGVLVLATMRPEEAESNEALRGALRDLNRAGLVEELRMGPLDVADADGLAARVANRRLDPAYLARLYQATKGNPLFVVESVRAKLEDSGAADADVPLAAVPRLQAVIAGRLAQLSPGAHELAGAASAIGTGFSFDLLARTTDWDEDSVARALDELWQRRIVEAIEQRGGGAYDFTHDRLREVAYAELSPVRRRHLHRRVAHALEELHAAQVDTVAGQIAAHCEAAGMMHEAAQRYAEAAAVARRRFADAEAATLAERALAMCRELPESAERDARELDILVLHADALMRAHGYAAPIAESTHRRALELSERLGETEHRGAVLAGAAFFAMVRGELESGRQLSGRLVEVESGSGSAAQVTGRFMLGINLFHLGQLAEGRAEIERAMALCADAPTTSSLFGGLDMRVFCGCYRAHALWLQGDAEGGRSQAAESVALARREAHPFSVALALDYSALLCALDGDDRAALAAANESAGICRKYAFSYYLAWSEIIAGWARARRGDGDGAKQLQFGIEALKATGAQLRLPFYYSLLAEAYRAAGQSREALASVATGFAFLSRNGELWAEPELHRAHGEALEDTGNRSAAAESYRKAVEAARRVGAAALEARAGAALERVGRRGAAGQNG